MLIPRHRYPDLHLIAMLGIGIHVHKASLLLEGQTAQKQIVNQTEDGSVEADPQRQSD